jgi:hypothetical protein
VSRKVEGSEWRCRHPSTGSATGECDVVLVQEGMEAHLRTDHGMRSLTPEQVWALFVLVRGAPSRGRPPGLGKTDDQTMTMFDREDFR